MRTSFEVRPPNIYALLASSKRLHFRKSFIIKLLLIGCLCVSFTFAFLGKGPFYTKKQHFTGGLQSELPSARVENLGNPWVNRYPEPEWSYARNIWTMRWFNNRLYVGGGNSSNYGLATNAGPVPILAFDESTKAWVQEGQVDDEQIDRFVLLDGKFATPGHDPRQSWKLGNLYIKGASGEWKKYRNIPDAVHTYDVISHNGSWFAALGTAKGGAIAQSVDQGNSWVITHTMPTRAYTFVKMGSNLYVMPALHLHSGKTDHTAFQLVNVEWRATDGLTPTYWFPKTKLKSNGRLKILKSVSLGQNSIYIGAYTHNDHQSIPFGVYVAAVNTSGKWEAQKLELPNGFEPWDIVQREDSVYLLLNRRNSETADVQIWRLLRDRPHTLMPVLTLNVPGFARSMEERGGFFYIGIGSEADPKQPLVTQAIHSQTGSVLRVRPVSTIQPGSNSPPSTLK